MSADTIAATFTVVVCPTCERHQLRPGAVRGRCPVCDTFFSLDDERPDRHHSPDWWERNRRRYPTPGKQLTVVPAPAQPVQVEMRLTLARPDLHPPAPFARPRHTDRATALVELRRERSSYAWWEPSAVIALEERLVGPWRATAD